MMNDLEIRCLAFVKRVRDFCKTVKMNTINVYENLGKADMLMKLRICRKEAKETQYRIDLFEGNDTERSKLRKESEELRRIFSAIISKIQSNYRFLVGHYNP